MGNGMPETPRDDPVLPAAPAWARYRAIDRVFVLARVSDLLADAASALAPAEALTAVSETLAPHLGLTTVVFFRLLAGQSRTLAWAAPGASAEEGVAAREETRRCAAEVLEHGMRFADGGGGTVATACIVDAALGFTGVLHVESHRTLDGQDRWLLEEILRRLVVYSTDGG
jgi:hypothetical protein